VAPVSRRLLAAGHPVPVSATADSASNDSAPVETSAGDDMPRSLDVQPCSAPGETGPETGRLKPDESLGTPMVSAGSAGTSSAAASLYFGGCAAGSSAAGPPLAEVPLVVPEMPLARISLAAAVARATAARAARTGVVGMIWVSSSVSVIRSSSSCRSVTTVGEAPPEPSDVSVRLSKPSSYDLTLMRLSLDGTPKGHSCQEGGLMPRLSDNVTLIRTLEARQSLPST
jgi:hypothetical protein